MAPDRVCEFPKEGVDAAERHFTHENVAFDFHLVLEARKTISVTVLPTQAVFIKAPRRATEAFIHSFLCRKLRWILKQKRYFAQFKVRPERRYVSGETFRYRGRSYKLLVRNDNEVERVSLQHGKLMVFTGSAEDRDHTKKLLDAWYKARAAAVLHERLMACLPMFDCKTIPGLRVRQMTRRWGSYSLRTNRVNLNRALIKAATRHIDYVIIHELCHMTHRKHDRAFYGFLESKLPQWRKLKTELELSLLG